MANKRNISQISSLSVSESDAFCCPVCLEKYRDSVPSESDSDTPSLSKTANDFAQQSIEPVLLVGCGHTVCRSCSRTMIVSSSIACPLCRKITNTSSATALPKNFALLTAISLSSPTRYSSSSGSSSNSISNYQETKKLSSTLTVEESIELKEELEIQIAVLQVKGIENKIEQQQKDFVVLTETLLLKETELESLKAKVSIAEHEIQVHKSLMSRSSKDIKLNVAAIESIYNRELKNRFQGVPLDLTLPKFQVPGLPSSNREHGIICGVSGGRGSGGRGISTGGGRGGKAIIGGSIW